MANSKYFDQNGQVRKLFGVFAGCLNYSLGFPRGVIGLSLSCDCGIS